MWSFGVKFLCFCLICWNRQFYTMFFIFMYMVDLLASMSEYHMCPLCPEKPEGAVGYPGTEVCYKWLWATKWVLELNPDLCKRSKCSKVQNSLFSPRTTFWILNFTTQFFKSLQDQLKMYNTVWASVSWILIILTYNWFSLQFFKLSINIFT